MEWISNFLTWFDTNKTAVAIIGALWGLWLFRERQHAERRMKLYQKTLEYYEAFSCQLFACMDSLCDKNKLKEKETTYEYIDMDGQKITVKGSAYEALLCAAGKATLVANTETRDLITKLTSSIINAPSRTNEECRQKVTSVVNSMNQHLQSYHQRKRILIQLIKWIMKK